MTKTTLLKKLLAVSLALAFMLSMPGMSAIAEAASGGSGTLVCDTTTIKEPDWEIGDGDHTVTITGIWHGTITYKGNGTMTIGGTGTIDASGSNKSAITVQNGAKVVLDGNVTVTGGKGTEITYGGLEPGNSGKFRVGGGVYVEKGTFELRNGTITGNTAQRGGGIFVAETARPETLTVHYICMVEPLAIIKL